LKNSSFVGFVGLGAIALLAGSVTAAAPEGLCFRTSYFAAFQEAVMTDRLLLIQVGSERCPPCRRMKRSTYTDPMVIETVRDGFVPLLVNGDTDPKLAKGLKVDMYPTTLIVGHDLRILGRWTGYKSPTELQALLSMVHREFLVQHIPDEPASAIEPSNGIMLAQDGSEINTVW
jgi:Protein of unknown function, DUF255